MRSRRAPSPAESAIAVALSAALAPRAALAQGLADIEGLLDQAVVSTASKASAQPSSTAPATTTTITADDLRRYGVHSLDEALNFFALGMVTETPRQTVEIGARGVLLSTDYGDHVLLLVDGHAVNEQWGGTAYYDRGAGIPFEIIDRIEIILGPGSVLYGSNAMLGVINIVTKRARDVGGVRVVVESELPVSIRGAAAFGKEFHLFGAAGGVTVAAEYYASHGPASPFGPQRGVIDSVTGAPKRFSSAFPASGVWSSANNPDLFFSQAPSGYLRLVLGGFELSVRGSMWRRWSPYIKGTDLADTRGEELDRFLSFDARYRATLSRVARLSTRVYGDLYDYREIAPSAAAEDCLEGQVQGCNYDLRGHSRWLGAEVTAAFDWLEDGSVVTLVGVDARLRNAGGTSADYTDDLTGKVVSSGPSYGANEKAAAIFAEQTARVTSWLGLNAGARLDVDERFGAHLSPRVAVVASPWRGAHVKALYAEAFRAPSAYERYFSDPKFQVAAADLRAETVRSVELSFEQRIGAHRVLATAFRSWWKDLVIDDELTDAQLATAQKQGSLDPAVGYAYQYRNAASVDNFGGSLLFEGAAAARRLRYGASVTASYARRTEVDGSNTRLPASAQLSGNARASYETGAGFPTVALAARFVGARPIANTDFTPTPSASPLLQLRATVSGPVPRLGGLTYRVSADVVAASSSPYAVGPLRSPAPGYTTQETSAIDHFRVTAGLEYHLPL
jgi:outer membrane receptor protein involved in Fe transport